MSNNKEFRIAVGTPERSMSAGWKFFVNGDDSYIAARISGQVLKYSLHKSNKWRLAFTNVIALNSNSDRKLFGWSPIESKEGIKIGPSIIIPSTNQPDRLIDRNKKTIVWLSPPLEQSKVVISTYIVRDSRSFISFAMHHKLYILKTLKLASGGAFVIASAAVPLKTYESVEIMAKAREMKIGFKPGSNTDKVISRAFDFRYPPNGGSFNEPVVWDLALTQNNYFIENSISDPAK